MKPFCKDFLWGASTSAYQVEGAFDEDHKGKSVQDTHAPIPGTTDFKVAADHYHHYKEDIALMAEMGFKTYRFSIAWTRIIPDGDGEINQKGVDFYHKLIDECLKHKIEPLITMYHFDLPDALEQKGGWSNRATIDAFLRYAKTLFSEYGQKVKYWLTINEQNMMILHGAAIGTTQGDPATLQKILYQQNHHMLLAQALTMKLLHKMCPAAKIGPAPNISYIYAKSCNPEDIIAAQNFAAIRNWLYLDMAVYGRYNSIAWNFMEKKGLIPTIEAGDMENLADAKPDFIAFNYYSTATVSSGINVKEKTFRGGDQQIAIGEENFYCGDCNEFLPHTQFGWEVDPIGFRITLREVYDRYRLPIIITENGLGAHDEINENGEIIDDYRIEYLQKHIEQAHLAVDDGVELFGYCPWSAIDLISTHQGFVKRYGFVYVNRTDDDLKDLKRLKKKSFYWYKKVISANGEDLRNS